MRLKAVEFKNQVRDMVTRVYEDLKEESQDYRELNIKCDTYCREIEEEELAFYTKAMFKKLLEHEIKRIRIVHD